MLAKMPGLSVPGMEMARRLETGRLQSRGCSVPPVLPMLKSFLKRQFLARDLWFQRKPGILLENWRSELRFDITFLIAHLLQRHDQIGRASCRERV